MKKRIITSLLLLGIVPIIVFGGSSCTFEDILDHSSEKHKELDKSQNNEREYDFVITPQNVKGDFRTFFQNIVKTYKKVLLKNGTYEIELVDGYGVFPEDGATITFEKNAKIKVKPNSLEVYSVIDLRGKKDITLTNPNIEGDKYTHVGTTGQWGYGINVANCSNIIIHNAHITRMWGDGINLRNCKNIKIYNPYLSDNRRQGISIESGNNIEIHNMLVENTGGQTPGYGLDIEPNWNGESVIDLRLYSPKFRNNGNDGNTYPVGLCLATKMSNTPNPSKIKMADSFFDIKVFDPIFEGDALLITAQSDYVKGSIEIHNPIFYNSKKVAVYIHNHQSDFFHTKIINPKFINCVQSEEKSIYLSPILFVCNSLSTKKNGSKNITITNPIIEAKNGAVYTSVAIRNITPNTFYQDLKNVTIENLLVKGYETPFLNYSGVQSKNSYLHPDFQLTFNEQSVLPNLNKDNLVSKNFNNSAIDHSGDSKKSTIYLNNDIPISKFEFYYKNSSKDKSNLKLMFGTTKQPSKAYIDGWSYKKLSGIEIPYNGYVKMKKTNVSEGIQQWTVIEGSIQGNNTLKEIK